VGPDTAGTPVGAQRSPGNSRPGLEDAGRLRLSQWKKGEILPGERVNLCKVEDFGSRLTRLGLELPAARPPLATYVPIQIASGLAFVSGHGPLGEAGEPIATGRIGAEVSQEDVAELTRLTMLNLLASLQAGIGDLERILRILQMRCFLAASGDAGAAHALVAEAAGGLLRDVFPDLPLARPTTIGIGSCALGLPVTIDLIAEISLEAA
jgi:enamine deaminase RidA (YjgF/YER057c/UK114 family)